MQIPPQKGVETLKTVKTMKPGICTRKPHLYVEKKNPCTWVVWTRFRCSNGLLGTARIRNGRTPARFMPKGRLMGLRTGGLSAPSNQLKAKSWREMDGWGIEALPSSTVGDAAAETPPRARFRTPARFMPKRCLMGLRTGGRSWDGFSRVLCGDCWRWSTSSCCPKS